MHIKDIFSRKKSFSMEVFPPKKELGHQKLLKVIANLKDLNPDFISVTYGAGGSTQGLTKEIASEIKNDIGIESMAHLTCVGNKKSEIKEILSQLETAGIKNILALRGDAPEGKDSFEAISGGFSYASELVKFIREENDHFSIGVAGYPEKHFEAKTLKEDVKNLKIKIDNGGDFIITQLFFNNDHYYRYYDMVRKSGIKAPVIPGIFLFSSYKQLQRTVELSSAEIPEALEKKLYKYRNDSEDVKKFGIEYAIKQGEELFKSDMLEGMHFYIMNRDDIIPEVYAHLKNYF